MVSAHAMPPEEQRLSDVETTAASSPGAGVNSSSLSSGSSSGGLSLDLDTCSPPSSAGSHPPPLGPRDFTLIRRIGGGDVGTVYLCRLHASPRLYAMKVVDRRAAARKNKLPRAATERRVLRALCHPFLPTLYADFDAGPHLSCAVTEFCPGGDLHALRHRAPSRRFPPAAARFYAAEVLLALEYLHAAGVVYRDLKPENVLLRADGHVCLTDFDLALVEPPAAACHVVVLDDAASSSCFPDRLLPRFTRRRKRQPTVVAEPVHARSRSFVGTHEYVAPEVARGGGHGAAVDWWALGVFLFELLHGRTPFAGRDTDATLRNIVRAPLAFPTGSGSCPAAARDLLARLLDKDPATRLGARRGAADVKAHPFFKGVNFALLRSARPPFVPGPPAVRRSQSCKAAPTTATAAAVKRTVSSKENQFHLFF